MIDAARLRELAINDAGFVFDPLTGHTYNVNETALAILNALKAGVGLDALGARLHDAFEVEPEVDVSRDVEEFVSRLREHGLVR